MVVTRGAGTSRDPFRFDVPLGPCEYDPDLADALLIEPYFVDVTDAYAWPNGEPFHPQDWLEVHNGVGEIVIRIPESLPEGIVPVTHPELHWRWADVTVRSG